MVAGLVASALSGEAVVLINVVEPRLTPGGSTKIPDKRSHVSARLRRVGTQPADIEHVSLGRHAADRVRLILRTTSKLSVQWHC